ncbi:MAG: helix-turn-helix transcriptional regulator [Rhodocyclaceae bacterium]
MADTIQAQQVLGSLLSRRRREQKLSQVTVAVAAGISPGYYCSVENSKRVPPPSTLAPIFEALDFNEKEIAELNRLAAEERGLSLEDSELPEHIQALVHDIRKTAKALNPRFVQGLRTKIREVGN